MTTQYKDLIQKVKDVRGHSMFDGTVRYIYTFEDGIIKTMDIELV